MAPEPASLLVCDITGKEPIELPEKQKAFVTEIGSAVAEFATISQKDGDRGRLIVGRLHWKYETTAHPLFNELAHMRSSSIRPSLSGGSFKTHLGTFLLTKRRRQDDEEKEHKAGQRQDHDRRPVRRSIASMNHFSLVRLQRLN
ncbi:MAG TPA: hypothetical protein VI386_05950 [Candidatus Sulfotelmatobacter sp.]